MSSVDYEAFATEFRDGLIGTQPRASRGMCALVSIPLRAAFKVLCGIDTELVTRDGHTFLVTQDGTLIDPTIDQFKILNLAEKVLVEPYQDLLVRDERLSKLPFVELMEQFERLYPDRPTAKDAGAFVAKYIYYPLAQQGFFEARM